MYAYSMYMVIDIQLMGIYLYEMTIKFRRREKVINILSVSFQNNAITANPCIWRVCFPPSPSQSPKVNHIDHK